ncbi:hypothetical protein FRC01_004669 [Tulasnella sp. 417]|nr:hypothetical protein FRC01_004669 [Tulasnella sp. 417]
MEVTDDESMAGAEHTPSRTAAAAHPDSSPIRPQRTQSARRSRNRYPSSRSPQPNASPITRSINDDPTSQGGGSLPAVHGDRKEIELAKITWLDAALKLETAQEKYIQLLSQQSGKALPGVKKSLDEKVKKHKTNLEAGLASHYEFLRSLGGVVSGVQLTPLDAHRDPIVVPSHLTSTQREAFGLQALIAHEKSLRIGQAFDGLVRVRKALGVRSFLTRHVRKTNGCTVTTRGQEILCRAELTVKQWAAAYRRCWLGLVELEASPIELKGLRALQPNDLVLLSTWLEDEKYRDRGAALPWIWSITPLPQHGEDVAASVQEWTQEIIRLEWVHAKAALTRWIEEVHLLREELRRIAVFFNHIRERWESMGQQVEANEDASVAIGYKAFAYRKAHDFQRLGGNALENISQASLSSVFESL